MTVHARVKQVEILSSESFTRWLIVWEGVRLQKQGYNTIEVEVYEGVNVREQVGTGVKRTQKRISVHQNWQSEICTHYNFQKRNDLCNRLLKIEPRMVKGTMHGCLSIKRSWCSFLFDNPKLWDWPEDFVFIWLLYCLSPVEFSLK